MPQNFADRDINYFKQFIKEGKLDAEAAMSIGGLNERQIPLLTEELLKAGLLKAEEPVKDTAPLVAPAHVVDGEE